jgi:hypothetical protein
MTCRQPEVSSGSPNPSIPSKKPNFEQKYLHINVAIHIQSFRVLYVCAGWKLRAMPLAMLLSMQTPGTPQPLPASWRKPKPNSPSLSPSADPHELWPAEGHAEWHPLRVPGVGRMVALRFQPFDTLPLYRKVLRKFSQHKLSGGQPTHTSSNSHGYLPSLIPPKKLNRIQWCSQNHHSSTGGPKDGCMQIVILKKVTE